MQDKGGHERLSRVCARRHVVHVEARLALDSTADEGQHCGDEQGGEVQLRPTNFLDQLHQVGKRAVRNDACERRVTCGFHKHGACAHGKAPKGDACEAANVAEVPDHTCEVVALEKAERHILSIAHPRACEVETHEANSERQQKPDEGEAVKSARPVAMAIHHAGALIALCQFSPAEARLKERANEAHAVVVSDVEIRALHGNRREVRRSNRKVGALRKTAVKVLQLVLTAGGPND
mmetsp:Transcript_18735/g.51476  ORF Transcript_18735/g.51476 Transcript_18735/m.51476 type:complete len:236 (-) Transcript_18735:92-799(-)